MLLSEKPLSVKIEQLCARCDELWLFRPEEYTIGRMAAMLIAVGTSVSIANEEKR